jgi:hypothetical protein
MTLPNLIRAKDLDEMRRRDDVLVLDCRFDLADAGKGEREHLAAHIPSAVYMHLERDLSDLSKRGLGRHPLLDPVETFPGRPPGFGFAWTGCRGGLKTCPMPASSRGSPIPTRWRP